LPATSRVIFEFNQDLDETLFEPVAKSYQENVAKPVQNRVSDFGPGDASGCP
jgi:phospholipid-binding lipoprotein MlaA